MRPFVHDHGAASPAPPPARLHRWPPRIRRMSGNAEREALLAAWLAGARDPVSSARLEAALREDPHFAERAGGLLALERLLHATQARVDAPTAAREVQLRLR